MNSPTPTPGDRFIDVAEVTALVKLSTSSIYALMKKNDGSFPACIKLSARCSVWSLAEVETWIAERIQNAPRKTV